MKTSNTTRPAPSGHMPEQTLCPNQAKQSFAEQCGDMSKSTASYCEPSAVIITAKTESQNSQGGQENETPQKAGLPLSSATLSGVGKFTNHQHALNAEQQEQSTVTITTIQDLLRSNGSAQSVTVRLTESTSRLIAAAPELLAAVENAERLLVQIRGQADNVEIYAKSADGEKIVASTIRELTRDTLAPIRAAIAKTTGGAS